MIGFSRFLAMPSAMGLPTTVATPPGGNGMIIEMGLLGHDSSAGADWPEALWLNNDTAANKQPKKIPIFCFFLECIILSPPSIFL
jgi:hypothetical protein